MIILNDFNTTVEKALSEIDPNWKDYPGLIICGTHSPTREKTNELMAEIKKARENGTPFLGICFGHQIAAIEYARNVLGQKNATSEELVFTDEEKSYSDLIVVKLPELKIGLHDHTHFFMGKPIGAQTYWNNFEVRPEFLDMWQKPDNFITCQYHPEYQSSKHEPHPLLVEFIKLCKKKK